MTDFVCWPAQHFLFVIKKWYFSLFSPSCFVCSSKPTSVWWWKLPSSTKLQFSFLSSVCTTGGRKAISKLMFPNSGCQFQWKTNLFLENLVWSKQLEKSLKKIDLFFDDVATCVATWLFTFYIEASSAFYCDMTTFLIFPAS